MSEFYLFNQNNSRGSFDYDEKAGITHYVIIEENSAIGANAEAQAIGLYFNGVDHGRDCGCCGDRWSEVSEDDATDKPMIYRQPAENYKSDFGVWMPEGREICVHFLDRSMKWYGVKQAKE